MAQDHVYVAGIDPSTERDSKKHIMHAATIRLTDGDVVLAAGENGAQAAPTHADDARRALLVGTTVVTLEQGPDGLGLWTWDLTDPASSLVRRAVNVRPRPDAAPTLMLRDPLTVVDPAVLAETRCRARTVSRAQ